MSLSHILISEMTMTEKKESASEFLEREAVQIYRQYRFVLPAKVKQFLAAVADFNNWQQLKNEVQK
jgi:hypothetical protein